ncbi:MAG: flagellar biosynthetic protein FliO [Acidimicrobiales bacterium]
MLTLEVVLRLVIALAVVVGGLLLVRWWSLRGGPRGRGIDVVARAQLGRSTSVVVVDVAGKRYLLGTAEQSVNLIAELDAGAELGAVVATGPTQDQGAPNGIGEPTGVLSRTRRTPMSNRGETPRIGVLAQLRRMTTRVPQGVRIHGLDD